MYKRTSLLAATLLLAAGCMPQGPIEPDPAAVEFPSSTSSLASSTEALPETKNVTYTGVVTELAASPVSEATHSLTLDSGRVLLLASSDANLVLESYLGKKVDVRGSLKVTGTESILRVNEVVVLEPMSSSASSVAILCGGLAGFLCPDGMLCIDQPGDGCDPENGGADCMGVCVPDTAPPSSPASSASSSSNAKAVTASSAAKSSTPAVPVSSSSAAPLASNEKDVASMSKQNYVTPGLWSQKYCTSHIGFCVPVHKNWYYKSFGATTSTLWHVEFGMSDIQSLGQGAISLNLISGSAEEAGGVDGRFETKGGLIVAYKNWDGNHIEIAADARLSEAVNYMLDHIERFEPAE